jgi:hypothetical protein
MARVTVKQKKSGRPVRFEIAVAESCARQQGLARKVAFKPLG